MPFKTGFRKVGSSEPEDNTNGLESFETLEVLPYYAQVHLRAVRQQTHDLPNVSYHRENTLQNVGLQGRAQAPDQKQNSGQKIGGRLTNGFKSSRPTLDTVYELHYFNDDNQGTNDNRGTSDLLDDEGNVEPFMRGSYDVTPTRYQSSEASVTQSRQSTLEVGSQNTTGFPPHSNAKIYRQNAVNMKSRQGITLEDRRRNEIENPAIYAYLHNDDGLSDMSEAVSELTDEASAVSSKKSKGKHNFAKGVRNQDRYSPRQENSSKSQRNSQTSDVSPAMDFIHHEKDSSGHLVSI